MGIVAEFLDSALFKFIGGIAILVGLQQGGAWMLNAIFSPPKLKVIFSEDEDFLLVEVENTPIYNTILGRVVTRRPIEDLEIEVSILEEGDEEPFPIAYDIRDPEGKQVFRFQLRPSFHHWYVPVAHMSGANVHVHINDDDEAETSRVLLPGTHECFVYVHSGEHSIGPQWWSRRFLVHSEPSKSHWLDGARRLKFAE